MLWDRGAGGGTGHTQERGRRWSWRPGSARRLVCAVSAGWGGGRGARGRVGSSSVSQAGLPQGLSGLDLRRRLQLQGSDARSRGGGGGAGVWAEPPVAVAVAVAVTGPHRLPLGAVQDHDAHCLQRASEFPAADHGVYGARVPRPQSLLPAPAPGKDAGGRRAPLGGRARLGAAWLGADRSF